MLAKGWQQLKPPSPSLIHHIPFGGNAHHSGCTAHACVQCQSNQAVWRTDSRFVGACFKQFVPATAHTPLTRYSVVKMHTCLRLPPNLLVHGVDVGTLLLGGKAGLGSNRGGAATKSTTRETETGVGDVHARQALTGEHTTTDVGCGGTVPPERVLGGRGLAAMAKSQALVDEVRLGSKSVLFFRGPNKTGRGDGEQ